GRDFPKATLYCVAPAHSSQTIQPRHGAGPINFGALQADQVYSEVTDVTFAMTKSSRANPGKDMVTGYGKIPKELADRPDRLADERRWSRAQMVAYCIEQLVESGSGGSGAKKSSD